MSINKDETLLVFRIAGIPFAVSAQSVGSILMPPSHITHTPGSSRSNPGIFHHAEYTYAIVDLHERFGIDTPRLGNGRLLLHEEGIRHFAFLVDTVVGLVRSEQGQWANLPNYLPQELFSIGFLYQNEIVLCSELSLLRNMHDVDPLRRHFEQLQAQKSNMTVDDGVGETTSPSAELKTADIAAKPASQAEPPPAPSMPKEEAVTPPPAPPMQEEKAVASPPAPSIPIKEAEPQPVHTKPTVGNRNTTRQQVTAEKKLPPRDTEQLTSPAPILPTSGVHRSGSAPSKPAAAEQDSSTLWLFLFLLLLLAIPLAYWFWPEPTREHRLPSLATPESPPVAVIEEPATKVPLQIEKDEDGTINLIIDRNAIANGHTSPADEEPRIEAEEQLASATTDETATPPDQPGMVEATEPADVTQSGACDCTHIVVKGDTLWDIAEQYTGDAFNYPELAKRSRIKNPHRIYPGDRVRIIIR